VLTELLKALAVGIYEIRIIELFVNNHVQHPQGKRTVGAGQNLEPYIGLFG
jgi:hypothetical protein